MYLNSGQRQGFNILNTSVKFIALRILDYIAYAAFEGNKIGSNLWPGYTTYISEDHKNFRRFTYWKELKVKVHINHYILQIPTEAFYFTMQYVYR